MTAFYFDGERLIQVSQIESVEPTTREKVTGATNYGDRPEVVTIEARLIRTISGHEYVSDGSFLEIVDMLISGSTGEEQIA